jgi:hypothetical protein
VGHLLLLIEHGAVGKPVEEIRRAKVIKERFHKVLCDVVKPFNFCEKQREGRRAGKASGHKPSAGPPAWLDTIVRGTIRKLPPSKRIVLTPELQHASVKSTKTHSSLSVLAVVAEATISDSFFSGMMMKKKANTPPTTHHLLSHPPTRLLRGCDTTLWKATILKSEWTDNRSRGRRADSIVIWGNNQDDAAEQHGVNRLLRFFSNSPNSARMFANVTNPSRILFYLASTLILVLFEE